MSNQTILEHASIFFKQNYPSLTAEAIICFLVLLDNEAAGTLGDIARSVGMTEPQAHHHLAELTEGVGVGLITLQNVGDGRNYVHLSALGEQAKQAVQDAFQS